MYVLDEWWGRYRAPIVQAAACCAAAVARCAVAEPPAACAQPAELLACHPPRPLPGPAQLAGFVLHLSWVSRCAPPAFVWRLLFCYCREALFVVRTLPARAELGNQPGGACCVCAGRRVGGLSQVGTRGRRGQEAGHAAVGGAADTQPAGRHAARAPVAAPPPSGHTRQAAPCSSCGGHRPVSMGCFV